MEPQPSFEPRKPQAPRGAQLRAFLRKVGRVLLVSLAAAVIYALIVGPRGVAGIANGLFIAAVILLLIALFPLFGEIVGRAGMSFRMADKSFGEALEEEKNRSEQGGEVTYLFGVSGIIALILSFILSGLG